MLIECSVSSSIQPPRNRPEFSQRRRILPPVSYAFKSVKPVYMYNLVFCILSRGGVLLTSGAHCCIMMPI